MKNLDKSPEGPLHPLKQLFIMSKRSVIFDPDEILHLNSCPGEIIVYRERPTLQHLYMYIVILYNKKIQV